MTSKAEKEQQEEMEIVERVHDSVRQFFSSEAIQAWRETELRESYDMVAGSFGGEGQWNTNDLSDYEYDEIPIVTINKVESGVDAVVGFDIQNPMQTKFIPRLMNPQTQGFKDAMENTVRWIEDDSFASFIDSDAFRDTLICGIGCVDHKLDYTEPPHDGTVDSERVPPAFCGWDVSARQRNLMDRNSCWRVKVMRTDSLPQKVKEKLEKENADPTSSAGMFELEDLLEFFDTSIHDTDGLTLVYCYQWREKEPFYRINNPFHDMVEDPVLMNYAALAERDYNGVRLEDPQFNLSPKEFRQMQKDLKSLGYDEEIEHVELEKWVYHRCEVVGQTLISKDLNFSQKGFSLEFITGKYSETEQMFYGMVRSMKSPQRLLDMSISDLQGWLNTTPKGGVNIEENAVDNIEDFIDTYAKAKEVTVFKDGALSGGKVLPKVGANLPAGSLEMIKLAETFIMTCPGLTPEFMGYWDKGNDRMSGVLYARQIKQVIGTLATFFNSKRMYMKEKGKLYQELVRVLAENNPGRLIRHVTGESSGQFFQLFNDDLAQEYDLVVEAMPQTPDEKQDTFEKLLEAATKDPRLYPLAMEFAPFEKETKDKALQMLAPPPPPQPDPNNVALIQAETAAKQAKAKLDEAKAMNELKELQEGSSKDSPVDGTTIVALAEQAEKNREGKRKDRELKIKEYSAITDRMRAKADASLKGKEIRLKGLDSVASRRDKERSFKFDRAKYLKETEGVQLDMFEENEVKALEKMENRITDSMTSAVAAIGDALTQNLQIQNDNTEQMTTALVSLSDNIADLAEKQQGVAKTTAKAVKESAESTSQAMQMLNERLDAQEKLIKKPRVKRIEGAERGEDEMIDFSKVRMIEEYADA